MRTAGLVVTGTLAAVFLYGAGFTALNDVFEVAPDKTSGELGPTLAAALFCLVLGGIAAFCFARIRRDSSGIVAFRR